VNHRAHVRPPLSLSPLFTLVFAVACGQPPAGDGDAGSPDAGGADAGVAHVARCTEARAVECEEDVAEALDMKEPVAPGDIENEADGAGFRTLVDATAGGINGTRGYVYGRFTDDGLEKVEIGDFDALESMDWDIAFKRFYIRINSGFSGPSCVDAASLGENVTFDDAEVDPTALNYVGDEWMNDCEPQEDGVGLPGSYAFRLRNWWTYDTCVQTTGRVFVLALANGRHVKVAVTHYYFDDVQEECNETGEYSSSPSGSANVRVRWAFVD